MAKTLLQRAAGVNLSDTNIGRIGIDSCRNIYNDVASGCSRSRVIISSSNSIVAVLLRIGRHVRFSDYVELQLSQSVIKGEFLHFAITYCIYYTDHSPRATYFTPPLPCIGQMRPFGDTPSA